MAYPEITIINCTTGEVVVREMTKTEHEQKLADDKENAANYDAMKKEQADRQAAREALLTKLGITADEAQLLLGA